MKETIEVLNGKIQKFQSDLEYAAKDIAEMENKANSYKQEFEESETYLTNLIAQRDELLNGVDTSVNVKNQSNSNLKVFILQEYSSTYGAPAIKLIADDFLIADDGIRIFANRECIASFPKTFSIHLEQ